MSSVVAPQSPLNESGDNVGDSAPSMHSSQSISDLSDLDLQGLLYGDGFTVTQRFGALQGVQLLHAIFKRYQVNKDGGPIETIADGGVDGRVTLEWFVEDQAAIIRHPDNERNMASNDAVLDESLIQNGVLWTMRGECWCIHVSCPPYLAISAGSLTASFYRVYAKNPDLPALQESLRGGVPCRLFHNQTPKEVRQFLKDYHNAFHAGCGHTFIEAVGDVISSIEPSWKLHMKQRQFTQRSTIDGLSFHRYQAQWLEKNFPNSFKSHNEYASASVFIAWLEKLSSPKPAFERFKAKLGALVDFQKLQQAKYKSVYSSMTSIRTFLSKHFCSSMESCVTATLAIELLKFTLPLWTSEVDDGSQHSHIKDLYLTFEFIISCAIT